MKKTHLSAKRGFLARLLRCSEGAGNSVVVGLVATGIALSGAAYYGTKTNTAVKNGSSTLGLRMGQGADGFTAGSTAR